jgi:inorganic triphosphatase YgiF
MDSGLTDQIETERKFDVSPDFVVPDLSGVGPGVTVTEPEVRRLAASYFDTSDRRLATAGITLRRRTGGADEGWHLKLPLAGDSRRELRVPLGDGDEAVPGQLASLVAGTTGGEQLVQIATIETRRAARRIIAADGAELAELADDEVTGRARNPGAGASPAPLAWREIEVELLSAGTPEILAATARRLLAAGAIPSGSASKLARVLAAARPS